MHYIHSPVFSSLCSISLSLNIFISINVQAQKLVEKATFPESASNSEQARYLYYYGRIKAIQLEYTEALDYLVKSLRKAPGSAVGFRQTVEKLRVTVELLLGNIPERQLFLQQANKEALAPYFELTKGNIQF